MLGIKELSQTHRVSVEAGVRDVRVSERCDSERAECFAPFNIDADGLIVLALDTGTARGDGVLYLAPR